MDTAEQQARDMLDRMASAERWDAPQQLTAGDVVELANLIAERCALGAEVERLREEVHSRDDALAAWKKSHERLTTQVEQLRVDAERYRWLVRRQPETVAAIAWGASKAACQFGEDQVDKAVDVAREAADAAGEEPGDAKA